MLQVSVDTLCCKIGLDQVANINAHHYQIEAQATISEIMFADYILGQYICSVYCDSHLLLLYNLMQIRSGKKQKVNVPLTH